MAGYEERPCAKCGTIIPNNVGGIRGAAGHANGTGPFCSVACWGGEKYELPAVPDHVWLGDLSGWSVESVTDDAEIRVSHRCGYGHDFADHDKFLGNIVQWVATHRDEHACADWYRRSPSQADWVWSPEEQRAVYRPIPRTPGVS